MKTPKPTTQNQLIKDPMLAEVSIGYRTKIRPSERPKLTKSEDAYKYLKGIYSPDTIEHKEEFYIILLGASSIVLGWVKVASGNIDACMVDPRLVFQSAILGNATAIILSHNHPSGNTRPSQQDIEMTRQLKQGGELLKIKVLDHIIVTNDSYYSFGDEGTI